MSEATPVPDHDQEVDAAGRRAAGRAVRDLGHALIGHGADPALLAEVAACVGALTARVRSGDDRRRDLDHYIKSKRVAPPAEAPIVSYDDRPFSGLASPWGLDLQARRNGDTVEAELTLRAAHEGAPGRAHGGIVAGLFDDVFGFVLGTITQPAFTGELSIRYERATPLHRPLVCRGRLERREGRKLWITGELVDRDEPGQPVLARGTGLFITVDAYAFAAQTQELPAPIP